MITIYLLCIAGAVGYFTGFIIGYNRGVEHTERRWSEAVGRREAH